MAKTCKYYKYQRYISYDSGSTWSPLDEYQKGELMEYDSNDCKSPTPQYRTITTATTCVGYDKYTLAEYQVSYDSGVTWTTTATSATTLIEVNSPDCGYIAPQYRTITTATTCVGYDKYVLAEYQVSYDGGSVWSTTATSATTLIEADSDDCGYVEPQYRTLETATTCVGYDKYTLAEYQVSYDSGQSWVTTATSATTLIESDSEDCGYEPPTPEPQYRTLTSGYTCVGYDKYVLAEYQVSYDSGVTWTTTATSATTLVETDSSYCGYTPPTPTGVKFSATYISGSPYSAECDSDTSLTTSVTQPSGYELTEMTSAVIGSCITSIDSYALYGASSLSSVTIASSVTQISTGAFANCTSLSSINIPSGVTAIPSYTFSDCHSLTHIALPNNLEVINNSAFYGCSGLTSIDIPSSIEVIFGSAFENCTSLTSITVRATTPPTIDTKVFDNTNNCPIYVPSASVSDYQTEWSAYASRIQGIS